MLFGYNVIDKTRDEHLSQLADFANSPDTLVFLDTNIVSYMYKLHTAARQEFFAWTDLVSVQKRLKIPAWCAGEYLARLREGQLHSYTPKSRDVDQPRRALEAMIDTASLFVDENLLNAIEFRGDRTTYLKQFREAIDELKKFTRAFKHQFDPETVHEEIQQHFGGIILDSNLSSLCGRAAKEGPARIEHRLPPAFRDESKPENRLGDLIIWFEILESSREMKETFSSVLFLTNDEKSDWVYAPSKRMNIVSGNRKAVPNDEPKLKIIDPRLVSEFGRTVGHTNITICSLLSLVEGLSKTQPTDVGQLAAAIQIYLDDNGSNPSDVVNVETQVMTTEANFSEDSAALTEPPPAATLSEQELSLEQDDHGDGDDEQRELQSTVAAMADHFAFDEDGYGDVAYEADAPGKINEIIRALKSHNWYTQNPAIEDIKTIRTESFPPTAWFVLGRNIYQAACGNARKAMDFMANLDIQLNKFSREIAQYILSGIVFEIYFDRQGVFRSGAKDAYLDQTLSVITSATYAQARDFIQEKLRTLGGTLLFLPGDEHIFTLRIVSHDLEEATESLDKDRDRCLVSAKLDGVEILVEGQSEVWNPWRISHYAYTVGDIVQMISSALLIPRWAIKREFAPSVRPDARFLLPQGYVLRPTKG